MRYTGLAVVLLSCTVAPALTAQIFPRELQEEERRAKLEKIMRVQDLRSTHDASLRGALSDKDSRVRQKAYLAYANLQDTTVLPLLTAGLADPDIRVQEAAAFALGETGTALSTPGRLSLEDDLLWRRLQETAAQDQLIEEIGKFGSPEALHQLILRVGNRYPESNAPALQMAIARFAIRGVTSEESIRYLLRFIRPAENATWQVVYALQRIGDNALVRQDRDQLLLLRHHTDALVRMNLAALLGKMKEQPPALPTLETLALHDNDWRVRVNALRALGLQGLKGRQASLEIVRASMFDAHPHIALTAIEVAGSSNIAADSTEPGVVDLLNQLKLIATNTAGSFHWHEQAVAASALANLLGPRALEFCQPTRGAEPGLMAELLLAAGKTGSRDALPLLTQSAGNENPRIASAAIDGLVSLVAHYPADTALHHAVQHTIITALESPDVSVIATASGALREPSLTSHDAVAALVRKLPVLRVPDDIEAYQEICATLGALKDNTAVPALREVLQSSDPAVARAASDALRMITGASPVGSPSERAEPLYTDFDFKYLGSLPDTIAATLETSRGTIDLLLFKDSAPFTVMALVKLARQRGFYRGRTFHRVVSNFVIQGGDPRGDGWGGPGFTLRSEFSPLRYETGTVGIASAGKDTEGSQFFITHSPQPHLDGRYSVVGKVIGGQEIVDQIRMDDRIFDLKIGVRE